MNENIYQVILSIFQNVNLNSLNKPMLEKELIKTDYYRELYSVVASQEDYKGNYNYAQVSNVGMIYLYIHQRGKNRSETTKRDYIQILLHFLYFCYTIQVDDFRSLTRFNIEQYQGVLQQLYPKKTTLAKKTTVLRGFLKWCYEEDYCGKDLARGLLPVKIDKNLIPEREIDEETLRSSILYFKKNPKIKGLLLILATTGLRLNEIITPKWGDLSYDKQRNKFYLKTVGKRGKIRLAHIKQYALDDIMEYRLRLGLSVEIDPTDLTPFYPNRYGKHYSLPSLSSALSRYMEAAGLKTVKLHRVTPHFLRHYFAQAARAAGASVSDIAETLEHESERTTKENYLRTQLKKEKDVSDLVDILI
ncbi:tyrosine-type recombinase/integrase [Paenibacillus sp. D51F]